MKLFAVIFMSPNTIRFLVQYYPLLPIGEVLQRCECDEPSDLPCSHNGSRCLSELDWLGRSEARRNWARNSPIFLVI